ncbi:MAG: tail assembly protein, partial [Pseudomonadota bacterium]
MLREIHLHGALREAFGPMIRLAVASPAEAIRGLCALVPGFRAAIDREDAAWLVWSGTLRSGRALSAVEMRAPFGERELHLVPAA